jgi:glucan-binding YG repeat protein
VRPEKQFARSANNPFFLNQGGANQKARIVTTNKSGTVYYVYFDGEVKTLNFDEYSKDHYFMHKDINSDGKKDMVFLDDKKLEVFEVSGQRLFDHEFNNPVHHEPIYFHFSYNDRKIGIVSKKANKIYLFNSNGAMYKGFPLEGNTPFSIGFLGNSDRKFNLVVGNKYNFLYNYSVN